MKLINKKSLFRVALLVFISLNLSQLNLFADDRNELDMEEEVLESNVKNKDNSSNTITKALAIIFVSFVIILGIGSASNRTLPENKVKSSIAEADYTWNNFGRNIAIANGLDIANPYNEALAKKFYVEGYLKKRLGPLYLEKNVNVTNPDVSGKIYVNYNF